MGLPGTRRLMDEMEIDSALGRGHDRHDPQMAPLSVQRRCDSRSGRARR